MLAEAWPRQPEDMKSAVISKACVGSHPPLVGGDKVQPCATTKREHVGMVIVDAALFWRANERVWPQSTSVWVLNC